MTMIMMGFLRLNDTSSATFKVVVTERMAIVSNMKVDSIGSAAVGELSAAAGIASTLVGDGAWKRDCCGMN
jgi:hypothetical protein